MPVLVRISDPPPACAVGALVAAMLLVCAAAAAPTESTAATEPEAVDHYETTIQPLLSTYCSDCHHPEDDENPVQFLRTATRDGLNDHRELWHSVAEQLRNRTMPPADSEQPSDEDRLELAEWIERTLRATACDDGPYAGEVVVRRLNRTEYENTIRDLFGLTLGFDTRLPTDGSGGEGFDNNGETLYLQPILMERYLTAAQEILDKAIVSPPVKRTFAPGDLVGQGDASLAVGEETAAVFSIYEPSSVTTEWSIDLNADDGATIDSGTLVFRIDGVVAKRLPASQWTKGEPIRLESKLGRGLHAVAVRWTGGEKVKNVIADVTSVRVRQDRVDQPAPWGAADWERRKHERLLGVPPGVVPDAPREAAAARVRSLAGRAFREPVGDDDVTRLMSLYDAAIDRGDPWEEACKLAFSAVLVSPRFLFRSERVAIGDDATRPEANGDRIELLDGHALATRLSYFLTLAPPDEALLAKARSGEIHRPEVLEAEARRLLGDRRSEAFSRSFVGQWLGSVEVAGRKIPDTGKFRDDFSTHLLLSFREEPVQFFDYLRRNDRPMLELITADYSVLNDHLRYHYGVETFTRWKDKKKETSDGPSRLLERKFKYVKGLEGKSAEWKRADLSEQGRGGLLGMGAVHLLTSYPDRTSPVLRGAWVLETLLGIRVPNPPPDVPTQLKTKSKDGKALSVREQLSAHRANPSCAACHNLMDPLGFAMEGFDLISRPRTSESIKVGKKHEDVPIDTRATLPDGTEFEGVAGLRDVLAGREPEFKRHLVGKMLGFALGRSLSDRDDCTIDRITQAVAPSEATVNDLVLEVVRSVPFRYRTRSTSEVARRDAD